MGVLMRGCSTGSYTSTGIFLLGLRTNHSFVVIIEREGKGRDTTYQVRCSRNPSSWEDQGWDEDFIFDGLKDLDALDEVSDYYALKSYSSQKSLYIGCEEDEVQQLEADDEEEEDDFEEDEEDDFEEDEEDDDSSAIEARLKAAVKGGSKRRGRRT
jgi:TATA-binding protein-associated factor Taf7